MAEQLFPDDVRPSARDCLRYDGIETGGRRKAQGWRKGARHIFCNSLMEEINPRDSTYRREK